MADSVVNITTPASGTPIRVLTGLGAGVGDQQVMTLADSAGNLLGTPASPVPMIMVGTGDLAQVAGALTATAANTPGTASTTSSTGQVVAGVATAGNVTFHLVSAAFVGTVVFEGSVDAGLNYSPIMAIREDGSGSETGTTLNVAASFIRVYTSGLPGISYFRVRCTAFTSGSLAVVLAPAPSLIEPNPSLAASGNLIGQVQERASDQFVSTTAVISTALTATLPAVAGQFHYITSIEIQRYAGAALTGAAAPTVVTTTNLPGGAAWSFDTAGAIGTSQIQYLTFSQPLKASASNTATTIVAPVFTGAIWRINVSYFTAA